MAIIKKITQPGNSSVSTLGGQIRIDEGAGTLAVRDSVTGQVVTQVDVNGLTNNDESGRKLNQLGKQGLKTFNASNGNEVVREGLMPDSTYGLTAAKPGETIQTIYG